MLLYSCIFFFVNNNISVFPSLFYFPHFTFLFILRVLSFNILSFSLPTRTILSPFRQKIFPIFHTPLLLSLSYFLLSFLSFSLLLLRISPLPCFPCSLSHLLSLHQPLLLCMFLSFSVGNIINFLVISFNFLLLFIGFIFLLAFTSSCLENMALEIQIWINFIIILFCSVWCTRNPSSAYNLIASIQVSISTQLHFVQIIWSQRARYIFPPFCKRLMEGPITAQVFCPEIEERRKIG